MAPNGEKLLQQVIEQLLFNVHLWKKADIEVCCEKLKEVATTMFECRTMRCLTSLNYGL